METESLLLCSQDTATGLCPERVESRPQHCTLFSKVRSNIILPSTPRSSEWSLSFGISDQNFVCISRLSRAYFIDRLSHPPRYCQLNNIFWSVQVMKLLVMQSPPASCHFLPLRTKHSQLKHKDNFTYTSSWFSHAPSICVPPLLWQTKFHTHTKQQVKW